MQNEPWLGREMRKIGTDDGTAKKKKKFKKKKITPRRAVEHKRLQFHRRQFVSRNGRLPPSCVAKQLIDKAESGIHSSNRHEM